MNILLVCAAGMSTSLLINDMKHYADENTKIKAIAFSELEEFIKDYDVILIGPQLRFKLNKISEIAGRYNKNFDVIDAIDYGRINGDRVLAFAKKVFESSSHI